MIVFLFQYTVLYSTELCGHATHQITSRLYMSLIIASFFVLHKLWYCSDRSDSGCFCWFCQLYGLPRWCGGEESACQCRRCGFDPSVRKIPWSRKWKPTPVFLPGKLMPSNCGAGEDSLNCLGLQEDQTSQSQRKSTLNVHWRD